MFNKIVKKEERGENKTIKGSLDTVVTLLIFVSSVPMIIGALPK